MRRVALIYNPASGQHRARRAALIASAAAVFQNAALEVSVIPTQSAESIESQVQEAMADGCDTIVACGGDGTIHHVLQRMVGTSAALGVIPLGTANALAADLGLSRVPAKAAEMLLSASPVQVGVGRIFYRDREYRERSRYFVVAAGIGADAFFFAQLNPALKHRLGYMHYLIEAVRLWATHTFPAFSASFEQPGLSVPRSEAVSQILAVRVSNFGGFVRRLVPGAALSNELLKVIAFKTRSRLRYLHFMAAVGLACPGYSNVVELVDCASVECRELTASKTPVFVEADGELLGLLPARIEVVPRALNLLIPQQALETSSHTAVGVNKL
jgi:diacylglycerol kinase (ATP)